MPIFFSEGGNMSNDGADTKIMVQAHKLKNGPLFISQSDNNPVIFVVTSVIR